MLHFKKSWLTSPSLSLVGILLGFLIGAFNKPLAATLAPLGELYLALLGMCVLPIIVTALISSVGKSLQTEHIALLIKRFIMFLLSGLIIASILGILIAELANSSLDIGAATKSVLSSKATPTGISSTEETGTNEIFSFLSQIVPSNIFHALSQGHTLSIVLFSILLGVALGSIKTMEAKNALEVIHVFFTAFLKIVSWFISILPLGLCFLFAGYASEISWEETVVLTNLLIAIYGTSFILIIFCSILVWRKSGMSYWHSFSALRSSLLIAFGSCSSLASIPVMLNNLEQRLHLKRDFVELIIPLGVNLFRQGNVIRYIIVVLFIAHLYDQPFTFMQLGILSFAAILASLAVSGLPEIASASIFAIILELLGLPVDIGMILFIAILPITEPIITLLNVHGNCTLAMLMQPKAHAQDKIPDDAVGT